MPRKSIDDRLAELEAGIDSAEAEALPALLERALGDKHYRVVALAAKLAEDRLVYASMPALVAAFSRFIDAGAAKRDPNCLAKKAVMRALCALDCDDAGFLCAAIRYRQPEPVWGGTVDTASDVRSFAAMALVASGYSRALPELTWLLADSEAAARIGAVRAVACANPREAEMLLRLKVTTGDEDPLVVAECLTGLMSIEPEESMEFVAAFLEAEAEDAGVREAAALALGESRLPAAVDHLAAAWQGVLVPDGFRLSLIRAAAINRTEAAFDWLLTLAAECDSRFVDEIVDALSIYRQNAELRRRLDEILRERGEPGLDARVRPGS